jgi:hypothetical protein
VKSLSLFSECAALPNGLMTPLASADYWGRQSLERVAQCFSFNVCNWFHRHRVPTRNDRCFCGRDPGGQFPEAYLSKVSRYAFC